jgi:hypothetical protein
MTFTAPVWITPPAKVKKLGIVTKIISNIYAAGQGSINSVYDKESAAELFGEISPDATITVTSGNYDLLVLNNKARLIRSNGLGDEIDIGNPNNVVSWHKLLDLYPGKFKAGLSQLRFTQPDDTEVVAYISLDPADDFGMALNIDTDTVPGNTIIAGRGSVDAIINPETFNPQGAAIGIRYLILEDINVHDRYGTPGYDGIDAWKNSNNTDFQAYANDIIEWDGSSWSIVFSSSSTTEVIYITNAYTGTQYKWDGFNWVKSWEGEYKNGTWTIIL